MSIMERAEVHIPEAIVDFFQAHLLPGVDGGDIDLVRVPANAPVGADVPDLKAFEKATQRDCGPCWGRV